MLEASDYNAIREEWVDCVILALDGLWRHSVYHTPPKAGYRVEFCPSATAGLLLEKIEAKIKKNEQRDWPAPVSEDEPIEHKKPTPPADRIQPGSYVRYNDPHGYTGKVIEMGRQHGHPDLFVVEWTYGLDKKGKPMTARSRPLEASELVPITEAEYMAKHTNPSGWGDRRTKKEAEHPTVVEVDKEEWEVLCRQRTEDGERLRALGDKIRWGERPIDALERVLAGTKSDKRTELREIRDRLTDLGERYLAEKVRLRQLELKELQSLKELSKPTGMGPEAFMKAASQGGNVIQALRNIERDSLTIAEWAVKNEPGGDRFNKMYTVAVGNRTWAGQQAERLINEGVEPGTPGHVTLEFTNHQFDLLKATLCAVAELEQGSIRTVADIANACEWVVKS